MTNNNNKKEIILETIGNGEDTKVFKTLLTLVLDELIETKYLMNPDVVVDYALSNRRGEVRTYQKMCNITEEELLEYVEEYRANNIPEQETVINKRLSKGNTSMDSRKKLSIKILV